jgi:hypothetical protein
VNLQVDKRQRSGSVALPERTFFDFLMVTRETPGTGFMPSFCIAFRDFFSLRLCFPRMEPSSAEGAYIFWVASLSSHDHRIRTSSVPRLSQFPTAACARRTSFWEVLSFLVVADVRVIFILLHLLRMHGLTRRHET